MDNSTIPNHFFDTLWSLLSNRSTSSVDSLLSAGIPLPIGVNNVYSSLLRQRSLQS